MNQWLLLIHQLPPKPDYLRVKVSRRLARIGAIPIKSTVYALPDSEAAAEDFRWTIAEITAAGGEANLCAAKLLEGLSDEDVKELFRSAREADYAGLIGEIRTAAESTKSAQARWRLEQELTRLRRRLEEIRAIDFFGAPSRDTAEELLHDLAVELEGDQLPGAPPSPLTFSGATWVTRANVHVDRMASAWLIRRFIDGKARFKFVRGAYRPKKNEVRFDMFAAEFTHQGDRCTFEVLLDHAGLKDRALSAIGQVIHDIDLKESRYGRPETAGIATVLAAIAAAHLRDAPRLERARAIFDDLHALYKKKR